MSDLSNCHINTVKVVRPDIPGDRQQFRHRDFDFAFTKASISSSQVIEKFEEEYKITAPEIVFLDNFVRLRHRNTGLVLNFTTREALHCCLEHVNNNLPAELQTPSPKVNIANEWKEYVISKDLCEGELKIDFDWAYCSSYRGHFNSKLMPPKKLVTPSTSMSVPTVSTVSCDDCSGVCICLPQPNMDTEPPSSSSTPAMWVWEHSETPINYSLLMVPDPILFYTSVTLFEDELHDHGHSSLSLKMRVMPNCWYLLLRMFTRVDNVVVKVRDTRFFYEFDSGILKRETKIQEVMFSDMEGLDLSIDVCDYRDADVVAQKLPVKFIVTEELILNK